MQIVLTPECDRPWREALSPWQEETLASLYRQGRHLPDRTNHGDDKRWAQAGVKTRDSYGNWRRNSPADGHERVVVVAKPYGYALLFIRRTQSFGIHPDTGEFYEVPEVWEVVDTWYVGRNQSGNYEAAATEREA